jgi:hypothetical protein
MGRMGNSVLAFAFVAMLSLVSRVSSADEPGWQGNVIARGAEREKIQNTPILERPYRPLHFYGNTVRRRHYRGTAVPAPRDVAGVAGAAVGSR